MVQTVGQVDLRGENISRAVKGFGLQQYKLKQVLLGQKSNKWQETYFRETATELTAGAGTNIEGVVRLATFPHVDPSWTEMAGRHVKFAAETTISMEDKMTDAIDVQARSLLRVARAVAKAVDDYIYYQLSNASGIGTAAAAVTWDNATIANRVPIEDILKGIQDLDENNYDALENGYLLVTPRDYRGLLNNSKVINNPSFKTADVVSNGRVGQIVGLTIIKSNSVTDDQAMIIIGQRAATWQSALGITTAVIEDKLIKFTIRVAEIGMVQVTDPAAIYVITGTQV